VTVFDAGFAADRFFIAMEFVEGRRSISGSPIASGARERSSL